MARHKRQQPEPDEEPALDISSLIDVCFLLLIYFIVTTTIKPRESDLSLSLPTPSENQEPPDVDPMLIWIDDTGTIYTGNEKDPQDSDPSSRNVPLLDQALQLYSQGYSGSGKQPLVQIYATPEAQHQRVIDVLNALARVKINAVTFTDLTSEE